MKFILGKKLGMTQIWKDEEVVPVTKIQAGPCVVTQVKNESVDGYQGIQVAFDNKKDKNINKPQKGHFHKLKQINNNFKTNWRYLQEFRLAKKEDKGQEMKVGDVVSVDIFEPGDKVNASGVSKGKGFQGVVKRHKFSGAIRTHGTKDQERMPGSAGAMGVGRIFKGKRMPGRMGGKAITTTNLEVIDIDIDNNILFLRGAVMGAVNGLVTIKGKGELQTKSAEEVAGVLENTGKNKHPKEEEKTEQQSEEKAKEEVGQEESKEEAKEKDPKVETDQGQQEEAPKQEQQQEDNSEQEQQEQKKKEES